MPVASDAGVGKRLRSARTARDLSIEEVAWRLRIRPEVLRAIEEEDFSSLGHDGFVRTHLHSYARALGLDGGELVRAYAGREPGAASPLSELRNQQKVARKHRPRSRWLAAAIVASGLLVAASVAGLLNGPGGETKDAAPSAGPRHFVQQAARAVRPLPDPSEQVSVRIASLQATTVRVVVDGTLSFEGTLGPGASRLFTGARTIEVALGESRAVRIWANETAFAPPPGPWQGSFGPYGLTGGRDPLE